MEFFSNVDVISVPVRKYDGYGLYILEANSAGVPVVQPATGAFPEIIEMTAGGVTYTPDNIDELSKALAGLLNNKALRDKLGANGRTRVREELSLDRMSKGLAGVYDKTFISK